MRRSLIILPLLMACTSSPPTAVEPTPPVTAPVAPPPVEKATEATPELPKDRVCDGETFDAERMSTLTLKDGSTMQQIVCEDFAYQSRIEVWSAHGGSWNKAVSVLGWPSFEDDTLSWLEKARGVGDCGDAYRYKLSEGKATLLEHRSRACDDNPEAAPPIKEWPLVE